MLSFPISPRSGQSYVAPNGQIYVFDGVKWLGTAISSGGTSGGGGGSGGDYSWSIAADDSTQREILAGETVKLIGAGNITTSSDVEGNITITGTGGASAASTYSWSIAADDSTQREIFSSETVKFIGAGGITTASDDEGNITITGNTDYNNLINKPDLASTYQFSIAADDSTQRVISTDELIKFTGAGGITTASDAEGNITINYVQGDIRSEGNINIDINLSDSTLRRWQFGEDGELTFPDGYLKIVPNGANPYISNRIDNGFGLVSGSAIQIRQSVADAYGISINSSTTDTSLGDGSLLASGSNIDVNGSKIILGQYTSNYLDSNTGLTGQNKIEINNSAILIGLDVSTLSSGTTTSAFSGWTFGTTGSLTFPDNTVQTTAWTGIANALRSEGNINIDINLSDSTLRRWNFGEDGFLTLAGPVTLPNGGELRPSTTAYDTALAAWESIRGGEIQFYIDNGSVTPQGWPMYTWHPTGPTAQGYIDFLLNAWTIQQAGGTLIITPAISSAFYQQLRAVLILIRDTYNLNAQGVSISSGYAKSWNFSETGDLTIPGGIRSDTGLYIDVNLSDSTLRRWQFGEDGDLTFPSGTLSIGNNMFDTITSTDILSLQGNGIVLSGGLDNGSFPTLSQINLLADGNVVVRSDGKEWYFTPNGDLQIPGNVKSEGNINIDINLSDSTLRRWQFGEDGHLTLPAGGDIKDSTGTSVLGGGSGSSLVNGAYTVSLGSTGTLTVPANGIITAPINQEFQLQAKDTNSLLRNEINLDPNNGTYMSVWSEELSTPFSTGAGSWVTASWNNEDGLGAARFTGAEDLQDFWTTGLGSFVESVEVSINGGARGLAGYENNNGGGYGVYLSVDQVPPGGHGTTVPITSLVFYYRTKNRIDIDRDGGQLLLKTQSMNINLETNSYINLKSTRANPVRIITNNNTHMWEFDSTGSLTLPREGKIYGIGDGGPGGNRYGYISWDGNSSAGGLGYNTMRLVPDLQGPEAADTYIILDPAYDPGDPGSIYIRAGGTLDNSLADLCLGGANSQVKIGAGANPPVTVKANSNSWIFGTDGDLTVPGDIKSTANTSIIIDGGVLFANVTVQTVDSFGGGVWRMFISSSAYPTVGTIVQVGDTATTAWGTPVAVTITSIVQDIGAGTWALHTNQDITTGFFFGPGTQTITINSTQVKTWTFNTDKSLTFPDGTKQTTAWTGGNIATAGTYQFSVAADDSTQRVISTDELIKFIGAGGITTSSDAEGNITITGGSSLPSQTGNSGKYLTTDGSVLSWATVAGGGGGSDLVNGAFTASLAATGDLTVPGNIRSEREINVEINLSDSTLRRWRFGEDGGLTIPGSITTTATTVALVNATATTVTFAGASTSLTIAAGLTGATAQTVSIATGSNTGTKTINIGTGGSTTNLQLGVAGGGVTTISSSTVVGSAATQALYNSVATTLNFAGAATTLNIGSTSGTITLNGPTVVGSQTTQNLYNTVATTVNEFGAATTINVATNAAAPTTWTLGNSANTNTLTVAGGTSSGTDSITSTVTTGIINLFTGLTTGTLNIATGGASAVVIGGTGSTVTVGNGLTVVGAFNSTATAGVTAVNFNTEQLTITGNRIATTVTNANLELECNGTGGVVINNVAPATTASTATSVGYLGIPASTVTTTATLTIADAGEHVYVNTSGQTITIPANSSVAYPVGTTLTFIAGPSSSTVSIAITTDTMYLAGTGTTGSRTLAAHGMATAVKVASTTWYINGTGLT
jgi:hypothetical protein